jgi:hypothetical protein
MTRRHDVISGKWFDEDMERCSACYLNHGHTHVAHKNSIADREVSKGMGHPLWVIRGDAALSSEFQAKWNAWRKENDAQFVLYDSVNGGNVNG